MSWRPANPATAMTPRRPSGTDRSRDSAVDELFRTKQTPVRYPSSPPFGSSSPLSSVATGHTVSTSATEDLGSSPTPTASAEPTHLPGQSAFESRLSDLLAEFAKIETGDYKACYAFARENTGIWDCEEKDLLRDAYAALVAGKEPHAKRCIQRAVMIQECSDSRPNEIKAFFEGLIARRRNVLEDFLKNCSDATANIRAKVPATTASSTERTGLQDLHALPALESTSLYAGHSHTSKEPRSPDQSSGSVFRSHQIKTIPLVPQGGTRHTTSEWRSIDQFSGPHPRMHQDKIEHMSFRGEDVRNAQEQKLSDQFPRPTTRTHEDPPARREKSTAVETAAGGRGFTSDVPTAPDTDLHQMKETLDERYRIRMNSASFFTLGRVFATPWHTTLGASQATAISHGDLRDWVVKDSFGESVLTHIQRMAVVKEGHGFSWCVFINTYQGRGVAKSGLSKTDRLAHAIIYMSGSDAKSTAAEKNMMEKAPIAVSAAATDQKLNPMSRINFGKVHTIEHNVKVMDVGKISRNDMKAFREYWGQHR